MAGFNFTLEAIVQSFQQLLEYIGKDWFQENVSKSQKQLTPEERANYKYLDYKSLHPLIEWYLLFPSWKNECEKSGKLISSEQMDNLALLAQSLPMISQDPKFEKLIERLKNRKQFYSTFFEIVIAAAYIAEKCQVKFIEEGDSPTPDLHVTDSTGYSFWVECKNRDKTNEESDKTQLLWQQVAQSLLTYLEQHSLNYQIVLSASEELKANDPSYIVSFITGIIEHKFEPKFLFLPVGAKTTVTDKNGRFQLSIYKLSEPNVDLDSKTFRFPFPKDVSDYGVFICERFDFDGGEVKIRNPRVIQFSLQSNIAHLKTVKHAFTAARKQLPKDGTGVIHIRLPINAWVTNVDDTKNETERYLRKELSGNQNRRVNAVIVHIYHAGLIQDGAFQYPTYSMSTIVVKHKNPL